MPPTCGSPTSRVEWRPSETESGTLEVLEAGILIPGLSVLTNLVRQIKINGSSGDVADGGLGNDTLQVFEPMSVVLDFGPFVNQRAFFSLQNPDAIVFPEQLPDREPQ